MTHTNPYESPTTQSHQFKSERLSLDSAISAFFLFVIVSFTSFFLLTLTFFSDSTAYWPGFVCGGIAIVIGSATAYVATRARLFQRIGAASLAAFAASSLLIAITLFSYSYRRLPDDLVAVLLPLSINDLAPGQWILISSSIVGSVFGLLGCLRGRRIRSVLAMTIGGACGLACICHLLAIGIHFVFA